MEKALKKYQDEFTKLNQHQDDMKAEQKRLAQEIEDFKVSVKTDAKKSTLSSVLKRSDSDKLAKLLAQKQIIDLEVEALDELANQSDNEVIQKAIKYIEKAQEKEKQIKEECQKKLDEALEMKAQAEQIIKENDFYAVNRKVTALSYEVRRNLSPTLQPLLTQEDNKALGFTNNLELLKKIITR